MNAQAGGAGEFRRPAPARRPPGPARRPPQPRAPRVQPGLRPQPLRRSPDPQSSARPCHLAALPARVCVFWSGLASGPSVPTGWAMPSRRVARSSAAPELGPLGKRGQGSGEESGAGLETREFWGSRSSLGVPTGVQGFCGESVRVLGTLYQREGRRQRMVTGSGPR